MRRSSVRRGGRSNTKGNAQSVANFDNTNVRQDNSVSAERTYDDNGIAIELFGPHHEHLTRIEHALSVQLIARGNEVTILGASDEVEEACIALDHLHARLLTGLRVDVAEVDAAIRMSSQLENIEAPNARTVHTRNRTISPRSANQAAYLKAIDEMELVFGQGPAGTGKTYLAVAKAVERLVRGDVDRVILSRPAVEAGERLGFLPGDMREKVDPYLRPLYDALYDMLPGPQVIKRLENGEIEVAPLAFMRGRTLANAFVILDEAQNTTAVQMKMFLTRLGEHSRMVITGDLSQVDLPRGVRSGLRDATDVLGEMKGVQFINFDERDVVRHPLVGRIVTAYGRMESKRRTGERYQTDRVLRDDDCPDEA
ncbi:MAG: phosphate starvation-inducible protein PhoH [Rhodospirillaceae bacterium TMED8]|nr:phosphate starvation-inducible protein PhoH [Magnetovibrio sp.]OUT50433.1 MAG: phosphate starvation-inducible protein PhoH [Rhodospirillaceae bacterium TMED8]